MSTEHTRRDFLRLSAAGLAAGAASEALPAWGSPGPGNPSVGEITVWVTDEKRRFERIPAIAWRQNSGKPSPAIIELNALNKFQKILGFGAAFTDASCYMFNQLSGDSRRRLFHELFHPSEMALNVCRTCIGSSGYSAQAYSSDD